MHDLEKLEGIYLAAKYLYYEAPEYEGMTDYEFDRFEAKLERILPDAICVGFDPENVAWAAFENLSDKEIRDLIWESNKSISNLINDPRV